jgi:type I restriction enzyme R subunit
LTVTENADYSEDALVERPAISLFRELGWEAVNCFGEFNFGASPLGRETDHEVVLLSHLSTALERLNSDVPPGAIQLAVDEIVRDRSAMSPEAANQHVYSLLKEGARVSVRKPDGSQDYERVRFVDWRNPTNNDFFLASQLWVHGDMYQRRCDLVGFLNGLPLVFIELKASHKRLENAYRDNLRDYKTAIPQIFWFNAFIILSNGSSSRIGSISAPWEHFAEWKKINDEGEEGVVSLDTMIRATCEPRRLLDIVENYTAFEEAQSGLIKKIGKNHQVLGVNRAIEAVKSLGTNRGRLGVFWHTQGSGKSMSMLFFSQKILRTIPGNWTFVIVTDRHELDDQIYKQFVACGAVTEKQAQAESGRDLKRLLTEDHRYVFTLIQKFRSERGEPYPVLSERSDIIVITEEAHRSQYDTFALNMRSALPNAAFIGFTGTPLMAGEERTKEVFGDYVSVYDFRESREDGATVPLYYENRIPELQLTNEDLNDKIYEVVEEAVLDEDQEKKLERELGRQYHLITREDRLETIAEDLVHHFVGRGYLGKAMVVSIDKATAVRMYDKVQAHWTKSLNELKSGAVVASPEKRAVLQEKIAFMSETDMAVVVSQSQNEIEEMKGKGLDIIPHRKRMVNEDLDLKFKDPYDPLRLVFVCAMWMTGFDVPTCSTIYLDKPMRNHTLMQTIARANRVAPEKAAGLIVDYVGVFRSLQKALAIYAAPRAGQEGGESPVQSKDELLELLRQVIGSAEAFCSEHSVNCLEIRTAVGFARVALLDDAVDALVASDEIKRRYLATAGHVQRLYRAVLPDTAATEFAPAYALFTTIAEKIRSLTPPADISGVTERIDRLLDESILAEGYSIDQPAPALVDLSQIDFEKLQAQFATGHRHTEIEKLRAAVERQLRTMVLLNRTRTDYLERFQRMVEEWNQGSLNIEKFLEELIDLAKSLSQEEKRSVREGLTEEELALFDLLTVPEPVLTKQQEADVKRLVHSMLDALKREKLVLDWRKRQQSRQAVRLYIEEQFDMLPNVYTTELYARKCDLAYRHIFDSYFGEGKSLYTELSQAA